MCMCMHVYVCVCVCVCVFACVREREECSGFINTRCLCDSAIRILHLVYEIIGVFLSISIRQNLVGAKTGV